MWVGLGSVEIVPSPKFHKYVSGKYSFGYLYWNSTITGEYPPILLIKKSANGAVKSILIKSVLVIVELCCLSLITTYSFLITIWIQILHESL